MEELSLNSKRRKVADGFQGIDFHIEGLSSPSGSSCSASQELIPAGVYPLSPFDLLLPSATLGRKRGMITGSCQHETYQIAFDENYLQEYKVVPRAHNSPSVLTTSPLYFSSISEVKYHEYQEIQANDEDDEALCEPFLPVMKERYSADISLEMKGHKGLNSQDGYLKFNAGGSKPSITPLYWERNPSTHRLDIPGFPQGFGRSLHMNRSDMQILKFCKWSLLCSSYLLKCILT
jgi:hypothetical protein